MEQNQPHFAAVIVKLKKLRKRCPQFFYVVFFRFLALNSFSCASSAAMTSFVGMWLFFFNPVTLFRCFLPIIYDLLPKK